MVYQQNTMRVKLVRITTLPISMDIILKNQLGYMNQFFEVIGVTGDDGKHYNNIQKREKIRMYAVGMSRAISPFKDIISLYKLFIFLKKEKPRIVHTHTPKAGFLGMLAAKLANVPVRLHTVAGLPLVEATGVKRKLLDRVEKITYRIAHRVYPNSFGLKKIISDNKFCKPDKLKVIANGGSNGVNIERFKPDFIENSADVRRDLRKKFGISENDIVFSFTGRISNDKGVRELIDAFQDLKSKDKNVTLKLILIGLPEKDYINIIKNNFKEFTKGNPNILYLGRFDDVRPYYLISDIFVLPSYREGLPNSLLEAGAMGLPSIATDINGCNEIVKNGLNGLIIPAKDTIALKEAMETLVNDHEQRKFLADNARSNVIANYKQELIWSELLKEYQSFL